MTTCNSGNGDGNGVFGVARGLCWGYQVAPERRFRLWLEAGQSFSLLGLVLVPVREAGGLSVLVSYGEGQHQELRALQPLSMEPHQPYRIIPRAIAHRPVLLRDVFDPDVHRARRVLLEIQHTGSGRPCWLTVNNRIGGTPCKTRLPGDGSLNAT